MSKIENILFWCMVLGFAVWLVWFGMVALAGESLYSFHTEFGTIRMMSLELFMAASYVGIGLWKMCVLLCFAIPWLSMKIVGNERV